MTTAIESRRRPPLSMNELPPKAIILNCFGRGGSSIIWNMIGSSSDVLMPAVEWHQGVFGKHEFTRKTMRRVGRTIDWAHAPFLPAFAARKTLQTIPAEEFAAKPQANATVLKVMDYHFVFNDMIERGFSEVVHIVLTRHPLTLCEALMRSGMTEARAIRQYNIVTTDMKELARKKGALVIRFEDLIASPVSLCDELYVRLGLSPSPGDRIRLKMKPFGAARTRDVDVGIADIVPVPRQELAAHIASDVNSRAVERLSDAQRRRLLDGTHASASLFGYTADNY